MVPWGYDYVGVKWSDGKTSEWRPIKEQHFVKPIDRQNSTPLPVETSGKDIPKISSDVLRQNFPSYFKNTYPSRYFLFHCNDEISKIPELSKFCDGLIGVIDRDFFPAKFDYPIHIYVLKNEKALTIFLSEKAGYPDPPLFGIYYHDIKSIVTYETSGNGTFAHEILHPLTFFSNLTKMPHWAIEGIPCFFEKSFGYWKDDELILRVGFHNPWRIKSLEESLLSLNLEEIITTTNYGHSEKRLVSMFLYKQGKLKTYMNQVRLNQKNGYNTFFEAAFNRHISQIIPDWEHYLRDVYENRNLIYKVPCSKVWSSKKKFDKYMSRKWAIYHTEICQ